MALTLELRRRVELFPGSDEWAEVTVHREFAPEATALIVCDMWDKHWSKGATERVNALAPRVDDAVANLRHNGVLIVHAPSETLDFYREHPARKRAIAAPEVEPTNVVELPDPPLPIDDSDGGSDTGELDWYPAWTRQHSAIGIADEDIISDNGKELNGLFHSAGVRNVLIAGVHTNMCVLGRSFGIKNLVRWRFDTVLVRDLTDAMYNPAMPPYVSHQRGTELVVEHIEKHWCPTTTSADLRTRAASP